MSFHPTLPERLARDFTMRRDERDAQCLATYHLFLKFFKEHVVVKSLRLEDAKMAVVLVFTWMQARGFDPKCWENFPVARKMLERDRIQRLNADEIDALKCFVGGSLIATSTFLHFANPSRYAMWDTNVARAAYRYTWQQCNRSDRYIAYLDDIKALKLSDALRKRIHDAIGKSNALRAKQFALLQLGIAESTSKSNVFDLEIADLPFSAEKFTLDLGTEEDGRY